MNVDDRREVELSLMEAIRLLTSVLAEEDLNIASEYVERGEYGVAYELIRFIVDRDKLKPPEELVRSGKLMGFDIDGSPELP